MELHVSSPQILPSIRRVPMLWLINFYLYFRLDFHFKLQRGIHKENDGECEICKEKRTEKETELDRATRKGNTTWRA
jgi:hypothetical protein